MFCGRDVLNVKNAFFCRVLSSVCVHSETSTFPAIFANRSHYIIYFYDLYSIRFMSIRRRVGIWLVVTLYIYFSCEHKTHDYRLFHFKYTYIIGTYISTIF